MPPTAQEVHDAIDRGAQYFKRCIAVQYDPADDSTPIQDADPVPGPYAAYGGDVGGPPLVLCFPIHGAEVGQGPWQNLGPGGVGYYPIKLKGNVLFTHINRKSLCKQTALGNTVGHGSEEGVNFD